jgi:signal peptidase I
VVNKFIYHWKKPTRGEVFVFDTQNIRGIQQKLIQEEIATGVSRPGATVPRQGSQHYIKRLAGTPGDTLEIQPPLLKVNGEVATEPGFVRVMSQEGYYTGYTLAGARGVQLQEGEYWALGDNSANSSDSRDWGIVPEENIVGRAAFVYYPFGHHFGFVD